MTIAQKVGAWAAVLIVVSGAFWGYTLKQREIGRLQVLLHVADSAHTVDSLAAVSARAVALAAVSRVDTLRVAYRAGNAKLEAVKVASSATSAALSDSVRVALAVARDSGATVAQLRAEIERVAIAVRSDSVTKQGVILSLETRVRDAERLADAEHASSLRWQATADAEGKRAADAERQVKLWKGVAATRSTSLLAKIGIAGSGVLAGYLIHR